MERPKDPLSLPAMLPVVNSEPVQLAEGANGSNTSTTTPKLRLTLNLSEIRAATPPAVPSGGPRSAKHKLDVESTENRPGRRTPPTSREPSTLFVPPFSKKGRPKKDLHASKTTMAKSGKPVLTKTTQPEASNGTETLPSDQLSETSRGDSKRPRLALTRVHFPEQVEFVGEMRKFRARKWSLSMNVAVKMLAGRALQLPGWSRNTTDQSLPPKTEGHRDKILGLPTFVCTYEECHKIFDSKDKWRRHQNTHRKRAAEGQQTTPLQLKLNMGVIKAASANSNSNSNPHPVSSALSSEGLSEGNTDQPS